MLVKDYMTKEVMALPVSATVSQARNLMENNNIRAAPITNTDGSLYGIVTQRDIYAAGLSRLSANYERTTKALETHLPLEDLIEPNVKTISPDTPLVEAAMVLKEWKIGSLPVTENNQLVGIISTSDLLAVLVSLLSN